MLTCRANQKAPSSGEEGGLLGAISLGKSPSTFFLGFGQLCPALNPTQGLSADLGPWGERKSVELLPPCFCLWLAPPALASGPDLAPSWQFNLWSLWVIPHPHPAPCLGHGTQDKHSSLFSVQLPAWPLALPGAPWAGLDSPPGSRVISWVYWEQV